MKTAFCSCECYREGRKDALEEAAKIADGYAEDAGGYDYEVSKKKNSECIAEAIRATHKEPGAVKAEEAE